MNIMQMEKHTDLIPMYWCETCWMDNRMHRHQAYYPIKNCVKAGHKLKSKNVYIKCQINKHYEHLKCNKLLEIYYDGTQIHICYTHKQFLLENTDPLYAPENKYQKCEVKDCHNLTYRYLDKNRIMSYYIQEKYCYEHDYVCYKCYSHFPYTTKTVINLTKFRNGKKVRMCPDCYTLYLLTFMILTKNKLPKDIIFLIINYL